MKTESKTQKKNEITIAKNNVPSAIQMLEEQIKQFDDISSLKFRTGCVIDEMGDIRKMTDSAQLIKAAAMILGSEREYNEAAEKMGIKTYPQFNYKGENSERWLGDIKLQYDLVTQEQTITKLKSLKKQWESLLSQQDKASMLAKETAELLQSIG